ncbi:MAG: YCF48-related protein [Limnobacter sp.]|nr:YCF48-related protein [Limnobacter sp.]
MSKPWLASAMGVRLKVLSAAVLLSMAPATFNAAWAAKDLLQLPAVVAPKAARALTLNIDSRGNRVVVVGERGIVLFRDQGAQALEGAVKDSQGGFWKQAAVPVSVNLTSVKFATDKLVFATGHDGVVLKSLDAGATWKVVFDGNKSNEQVLAAAKAKLDALTQAVEAKRAAPASKGQSLEEMEVALETLQFAFEDAEAGARFGPARPMLDVWFKDDKTGWVVGSYGQIFETVDGGNNWKLIADRLDNPDSRHYNGLWGDGKGMLLIAGEAGRVYQSNDFGATWKRHDTGYNGHFYGALATQNAAGETSLLAYGFRGNAYRFGAGADKWLKLASPTTESLVGAVADAQRIVLVDQAGRLVVAENAATTLRLLTTKEGTPTTGLAKVGAELIMSAQGGPRTSPIPQ